MSEIYTPEIPDVPETPSSAPASGDTSKDWMAIVSLVASILALCTSFIPIICCAAPILAIGGVVLGILGLKSSKRTLAIIGLALGGVALLAQVIILLVGVISGSYMENIDTIMEQMEQF